MIWLSLVFKILARSITQRIFVRTVSMTLAVSGSHQRIIGCSVEVGAAKRKQAQSAVIQKIGRETEEPSQGGPQKRQKADKKAAAKGFAEQGKEQANGSAQHALQPAAAKATKPKQQADKAACQPAAKKPRGRPAKQTEEGSSSVESASIRHISVCYKQEGLDHHCLSCLNANACSCNH